jgi:monoterpene epsilon-lactone hydrolase
MKKTALLLTAACAALLIARQNASRFVPQTNSSFIDADGTAHVTRVVPVPQTISPEARQSLSRQVSDSTPPDTLAERRRKTDAWQSRAGEAARAMYPVNIAADTIAGVPVRIVTPLSTPREKTNRLLINLHGGGFNSDSGSLTESIPVANLTQTKVVAVLYRLAPEHPFPAAVEDAVAVYKELLKSYTPKNIGIYGTSAGAILTAEVAVKLAQSNLPLPAALGIFSGMGDFSRNGDSISIYALDGFSGPLRPASHDSYTVTASPKDPVLSPIYADLKNFPPALFVTSTRDLLLSGTTILHRAFLRAGVDAQLVVFEALPHAFWNDVHLPESQEMHQISAQFFDRHLGGPRP